MFRTLWLCSRLWEQGVVWFPARIACNHRQALQVRMFVLWVSWGYFGFVLSYCSCRENYKPLFSDGEIQNCYLQPEDKVKKWDRCCFWHFLSATAIFLENVCQH